MYLATGSYFYLHCPHLWDFSSDPLCYFGSSEEQMPRGDQTCKKFTVEAAVKDQGGQSRRRWEGPSGHGVGLAARGERGRSLILRCSAILGKPQRVGVPEPVTCWESTAWEMGQHPQHPSTPVLSPWLKATGWKCSLSGVHWGSVNQLPSP